MFISRKVRRKFNALGNGETPTIGEKNLGPLSDDTHTGKFLRDRQTRRLEISFLAVLATVTAVAGIYLGLVLNAYMRENMVRSVANATAYHMEVFLEPLIQDGAGTDVLAPEIVAELDRILPDTASDRRLEALRIWREDGTIAYSTNKSEIGARLPSSELDLAFKGHEMAFFGQLTAHGHDIQKNAQKPLLEAYFPLKKADSDEIIAVGEFYEDATELKASLNQVRLRTWSVIVLASTIAMVLLGFAAARTSAGLRASRKELARRLDHERELARQNADLRNAAEQARLSAIVTNENLLAKIGSDIHDGPIQMLTLLAMKLSIQQDGEEQKGRDPDEFAIATQVMQELRDISQGLVLPELEGHGPDEALMMAIRKHESLTGTSVSVELEPLPENLENAQITCLYRVVQECLSNAYRHAGGKDQSVQASVVDDCIEVRVSDGGPGCSLERSKNEPVGLGMTGLTKRLQALGGSLTFTSAPRKGMTVIARLPVGQMGAVSAPKN